MSLFIWVVLVEVQSFLWWPHWSPARTLAAMSLLLAMFLPMQRIREAT